MKFIPIPQSGVYGYTATVGDRTAEVVRSYPGDWFVFAKIGKSVCKAWDGSSGTYAVSLAGAKAFLNREVTPETWS